MGLNAPLSLVWRAEARADLAAITAYIAERNPDAAERLRSRIEALVEGIPAHPHMFRPGRVLGTREAVTHPNYIVVYRVEAEYVRVLSIIHARQRYP